MLWSKCSGWLSFYLDRDISVSRLRFMWRLLNLYDPSYIIHHLTISLHFDHFFWCVVEESLVRILRDGEHLIFLDETVVKCCCLFFFRFWHRFHFCHPKLKQNFQKQKHSYLADICNENMFSNFYSFNCVKTWGNWLKVVHNLPFTLF